MSRVLGPSDLEAVGTRRHRAQPVQPLTLEHLEAAIRRLHGLPAECPLDPPCDDCGAQYVRDLGRCGGPMPPPHSILCMCVPAIAGPDPYAAPSRDRCRDRFDNVHHQSIQQRNARYRTEELARRRRHRMTDQPNQRVPMYEPT